MEEIKHYVVVDTEYKFTSNDVLVRHKQYGPGDMEYVEIWEIDGDCYEWLKYHFTGESRLAQTFVLPPTETDLPPA